MTSLDAEMRIHGMKEEGAPIGPPIAAPKETARGEKRRTGVVVATCMTLDQAVTDVCGRGVGDDLRSFNVARG